MKYYYNPPVLVKKLFSDFQWNSVISRILLTFDDGPNPHTTESILTELDKLRIKTIFFCVGENLEKYPTLAKEILSQGHEIGNHTQKHSILSRLNRHEAYNSIKHVQYFALTSLDYKIKYFRPPHGRFNLSTNNILKDIGLINVMWSLLTYDYKNDLNIVKFALAKYLTQNSIIVLHDSNKSKNILTDSIKIIAEEADRKSYKIGKPSECLK